MYIFAFFTYKKTDSLEISSKRLHEIKSPEVDENSIEALPLDGTAGVENLYKDDDVEIFEEDVTEEEAGVSPHSRQEEIEGDIEDRDKRAVREPPSIEKIWAEEYEEVDDAGKKETDDQQVEYVEDAGKKEIDDQEVWQDNISTYESESKRRVTEQDDVLSIEPIVENKELNNDKEDTNEVFDQDEVLIKSEDPKESTKKDDFDLFPVQEEDYENADRETDEVEKYYDQDDMKSVEIKQHEVSDVLYREDSEISQSDKDEVDADHIHHDDLRDQDYHLNNEILKEIGTDNQYNVPDEEPILKAGSEGDADADEVTDKFHQSGQTLDLTETLIDEDHMESENITLLILEEKVDKEPHKAESYESIGSKHMEKPSDLQTADDKEPTGSIQEIKISDFGTETSKFEADILKTPIVDVEERNDEVKQVSVEDEYEIHPFNELSSPEVALQTEQVVEIEDPQKEMVDTVNEADIVEENFFDTDKESEDLGDTGSNLSHDPITQKLVEAKEGREVDDDSSFDSALETSVRQDEELQSAEKDFHEDELEVEDGKDTEELYLEEEDDLMQSQTESG